MIAAAYEVDNPVRRLRYCLVPARFRVNLVHDELVGVAAAVKGPSGSPGGEKPSDRPAASGVGADGHYHALIAVVSRFGNTFKVVEGAHSVVKDS